MAVIRVEPDELAKHSRCAQCGGTTWMTLGYVYADDEPHGLYYVDWCEGDHEERVALVTVSIGDHADEDATGADREAFGLDTTCDGLSLSPAPVRDRPDFLGRFVPRDEALERPDLDELWHICDHLPDDPRFAAVTGRLCGDLDTGLA